MKKIIVFSVLSFCFSMVVFAQDQRGFKFSAGPELSFATGSFSNTSSFGIGATAQADISLQPNLYGTLTGGIHFFNGKSIAGTSTKNTGPTIIPVRVGVKYFVAGRVYGAVQMGVAFISNNMFYNGTAFAYSPQLGYEFNTKSGRAVDATLKYDGYTKNGIGALGFRLAYVF